MIDTHCHLYAEELSSDFEEVLKRAEGAGLKQIWLPNIDEQSIERLFDLTERDPNFFKPMLGLHPCYVKPEGWVSQLEIIHAQIQRIRPIAIGEIGLDLYWDKSTINSQKKALIKQYEWAYSMQIPVVLHSREAFQETLEIARQFPTVRGIFHCFTGSTDDANQAIEAGYLLGVGGVLTYKNSSLKEVLSTIDLQHLVLETDSPYLSPVPYRGKRNEPGFLVYIAKQLAEIKGISTEEVIRLTTLNARKLIS